MGKTSETKTKRAELLKHALRVARKHGYKHCSRAQIAEEAGCSANLLNYYFDTLPKLHRAIMGEAIRVVDLDIIAQGLLAKDPRVENISEEIRAKIRARI